MRIRSRVSILAAAITIVFGTMSSTSFGPTATADIAGAGQGYWLVASDGGLFAFGDAPFYGSPGATALTRPLVGMAATPAGKGYWLVASDGGLFAFGDADFHGSGAATPGAGPVVGMAPTPSGRGYMEVTDSGQVLVFGDAPDVAAPIHPARAVVGLAVVPVPPTAQPGAVEAAPAPSTTVPT